MFLFQMGQVVYFIKGNWAVKKKQYNSEQWSYWILSKSPKIYKGQLFFLHKSVLFSFIVLDQVHFETLSTDTSHSREKWAC